jgi:hypothetical protein
VNTSGTHSSSNASSGSSSTSSSTHGSSSAGDGGTSPGDGGSSGDGAVVYTLIDNMETTVHGPIEFDAGYTTPETQGYWFNFGASKLPEAGPPLDMATPPITVFSFTVLPAATTTLNGATSHHAAAQACTLNVLYDVCGIGLEFAQVPLTDGGVDGGTVDASIHDAGADGDAGPPIPMVTVPFDISAYKGITFWGRTDFAGDAGVDAGGGLDVKVLFPDTDTDPRGDVCNDPNNPNSGAASFSDTSQCYNSYAEHLTFTSDWQQFTVMFGDLAIDPSFGYQYPLPFDGTKVYGINWQAQDNAMPDASAQSMGFWIDDVYFIK